MSQRLWDHHICQGFLPCIFITYHPFLELLSRKGWVLGHSCRVKAHEQSQSYFSGKTFIIFSGIKLLIQGSKTQVPSSGSKAIAPLRRMRHPSIHSV